MLAKIRCAVVGPDWVRLGAVHVKCRVMNLTQFADLDILYKDHDREVYERLRDADNSDPVSEYENGATDFLCNHEVEAERWDPYWNDDGMEGWDTFAKVKFLCEWPGDGEEEEGTPPDELYYEHAEGENTTVTMAEARALVAAGTITAETKV